MKEKKMFSMFAGGLLFAACGTFDPISSSEDMCNVEIALAIDDVKVCFNGDRSGFQWNDGDGISVFNDYNTLNVSTEVRYSKASFSLPDRAEKIAVLYPYSVKSEKGPSKAVVTIPARQVQEKAGVFPGGNYPMCGSGTLLKNDSGKAVGVTMRAMTFALALNIYDTGANGTAGREIKAVRVTPLDNEGFAGEAQVNLFSDDFAVGEADKSVKSVVLNVREGAAVGATKPEGDGKKMFASQLYVSLARQKYTRLQFDIILDECTYRLVSSPTFEFDGQKYDIIIAGLNIANGSIAIDGVSGEEYEAGTDVEKLPADLEVLQWEDACEQDRIPDFSRVGYKYSDAEIPSYPVKATISPESVAKALSKGEYPDTSSYFQAVIDKVQRDGGGTVLVKKGRYNIGSMLFIDADNTVLRGESSTETILYSPGTKQKSVVNLGKSRPFELEQETDDYKNIFGRFVKISHQLVAGPEGAESFGKYTTDKWSPLERTRTIGASVPVIEDYVPVGRLFVRVLHPEMFSVGEEVVINRPVTKAWISDIGMDKIPDNGRTEAGSPTSQWDTRNYKMYSTRVITAIKGDILFFDAPIVQALDKNYGGGFVCKQYVERISGSGVENIRFESAYDATKINANKRLIDDKHAWIAVNVYSAKDCWVRDVTCKYMGMSLCSLNKFAYRITVRDCRSEMPVSLITGGRRYAFVIGDDAELCLVRDCTCDYDRHCFVTNCHLHTGPNVFTNCTATHSFETIGPHMGWDTGTLFDCIKTSRDGVGEANSVQGMIAAQDRGNSGNGHGWTSANDVFWNCESDCVVNFNPWAKENTPSLDFASDRTSGRNYMIGAVGKKLRGFYKSLQKDYYGKPVQDYYMDVLKIELRPDGTWYPWFDYDESGTEHIALPCKEAEKEFSWWPEFTISNFSDPLSLYQSQLEDRHARGIYLNMF